MRKTLSDKGVAALKPHAQRRAAADPELAGLYIRIQPSGAKSYCAVARSPAGKQIWTTIATTETMPIAEARVRAREIMRRVRDGLPAVEPRGELFGGVARAWRARHVEKNRLRSAYKIDRLLDGYIMPAWKDREFAAIRRSDVSGWVRNRSDGAVEALVRGPPSRVEALIAKMRQGPRFAVVDRLRVTEHDGTPYDDDGTFVVR